MDSQDRQDAQLLGLSAATIAALGLVIAMGIDRLTTGEVHLFPVS
jgi:hypothetical protein